MSWYRQSWRHSLAARKIKTGRKKLTGKPVLYTKHGIPITIRRPYETLRKGRAYPLSPEDVKEKMDKFSEKEVKGITEISFRDPGIPATKQDKAWAQYVRGKRRINVFSQPMMGDKFRDVEPEFEKPGLARSHMRSYVLPHETGHHYIQHNLGFSEDPMLIEEARADAFTYGKNPFDKPTIDKFIKSRQQMFGEKGTI